MGKSAFEKLTPKQQLYVTEFIGDQNQTRAAKEAGYPHPNTAATKLMANPKVKAAIEEVMKPLLEKNLATAERVVEQLTNFLFRTIKDYVDEDGILIVNVKKLPDAVAQCIDGWKVKQFFENDPETGDRFVSHQEIECKLVSKAKMMELMLRYHGLIGAEIINKTVNNTLNVNGADAFWREAGFIEEQRSTGPIVDAVEARIKEIEALPDKKEKQ